MKKIFGSLPSLGTVFHRFPIAALAMASFTLILIIEPNVRMNSSLWRLLFGLIVGGYISVIITLAREVMQRSPLRLIQGLIVLIIAVLFWFSESLRLNIAMALGAVLLMLGNAVGWRQVRNDLHIWDFTHKLWTSAVLAAAGSVIFLLGTLSIQVALKTLLGVDINWLTEDFIIPIGLGFLAPLYWMSTLPPVNEPYEELYDNPGFVSKAIGFLGTWLLAPLSMIYALIILLYGAKIMMTMSLPKGEIAELTLPFLFIGTLTWLLLEPPFIQKTALARWFRWLWFPVSIPVALLLAIAVAVRISFYGYTEERFALVLAVVWVFAIGIWFTFKKEAARDIRLIPGIGAALLVAGTFMAQPISINSQTLRAKTIVNELGLVTESGDLIAISNPAPEQTERLRILKGKLVYLYRKKTFRSLKRVFLNSKNLEDAKGVYTRLGIENLSIHNEPNQPIINYQDDKTVINVSEFDWISADFSYYASLLIRPRAIVLHDDPIMKIAMTGADLSVTRKSNDAEVSLNLVQAIEALGPSYTSPVFIDIDDQTRVYINLFRISNNKDTGNPEVGYAYFKVLMKDQTIRE